MLDGLQKWIWAANGIILFVIYFFVRNRPIFHFGILFNFHFSTSRYLLNYVLTQII